MDSTTLTRTLTIMGRHGWIAKRRGKTAGSGECAYQSWRDQFKHALPYWENAQRQVLRQLGDELSDNIMKLTQETTNALID
jgi:hypothetical protein